ncbi:acyl carrier protein [Helicobacter saguini]|uniref:Acyl carrier protein n=1 Tax=Helicobacter saguini TaxID=1548018 RepID=A0A347VNE5_9HELI|nr:acyl carrier protein [Helicobacter saguini]MWV61800.1 acyl carrier protein [Helicobacter saguini]MWV67525.1 acyl carrier protein [Helicobacter saguini]MWV69877.1 acyl carrier protein [Helicobacter saguini]MWV72906.1 acyl carrier protein [Helicobacter saguini]TLD93259.1 acyl carrier protein [Helicobacter saguini]
MDVDSKVRDILGEILGVEIYDDIAMSNCKEWTSLAHIDIIMSLEEEFEISFKQDDLVNLTSLKALVDSIKELKNA